MVNRAVATPNVVSPTLVLTKPTDYLEPFFSTYSIYKSVLWSFNIPESSLKM